MQTRRRRRLEAAPPATSPAAPQTSILQLPDSILVQLLGQLELQFRLGTASLVCRSWARAAAEASTAITVSKPTWSEQQLAAAAAWLRKHAAAAALHQLVLRLSSEWRWLPAAPAPYFAPPLEQLLQLRVLQLPECVLPHGSIKEMSSLTSLTSLQLHAGVVDDSGVVTRSKSRKLPTAQLDAADQTAASPSDLAHALQQLPALTHINLIGAAALALLPALTGQASIAGQPRSRSRRRGGAAGTSNSALSSASNSRQIHSRLQQQLVSLEVWHDSSITPELVAALPTGLTRLVLAAVGPGLLQRDLWGCDVMPGFSVSQLSTPRLSQLTNLVDLRLHGLAVGHAGGGLAELFAGLKNLTSFSMNGYEALLSLDIDANTTPELADFMAAMGHLTNLRRLSIAGAWRCTNPGPDEDTDDDELLQPPSSAPLCASLVASTNLTSLVLNGLTLPLGSGEHIFGPVGFRLPHLQELDLQGLTEPEDPGSGYYIDPYLRPPEDLLSIIGCCAGGCLRKLTLEGVFRGSCSVATLSALTTLTYLSLGDTKVRGVEEIVQLRELRLDTVGVDVNTLAGIATRLTQLTAVLIQQAEVREAGALRVVFDYEAIADDAPHVDGRFKEECGCRDCWPRATLDMPVCEDLQQTLRDDVLWPDSESDDGSDGWW